MSSKSEFQRKLKYDVSLDGLDAVLHMPIMTSLHCIMACVNSTVRQRFEKKTHVRCKTYIESIALPDYERPCTKHRLISANNHHLTF